MKKTTALVFDHRGRTKEGARGPIEIRVTVDRRLYHFGTGIKVHSSEFVAGRIVNCPGADKLNERIAIIYSKVLEMVNDSIDRGLPIDAEYIRRQVWKVKEQETGGDTLLDWVHQQIPILPMSDGTRKHYYSLETRLREFGLIRRWEDVTTERIFEWDAWLHSLTKPLSDTAAKTGMKAERLCDGTIYNYHKWLKMLLNRADRFGKIDRSPYERLKGQFKRGEKENIEYLTDNEVQHIRELKLKSGSPADAARDLFIFQVFTGLSYSDAQAFDFSQYKFVDGSWRYVGQRIKTGVPFVSQLLPPVVGILEKYGWSVPYINNTDYNRRLKDIGSKAGIVIPLHSHLARHTFATMMLRNGAKIENVSRMLGHTKITQTQRYAKVLAQSVHDDFEKVAKKWK